MDDVFIVLISISISFFALLGVKQLFSEKIKNKFCVICAAVVLNWIALLILYWAGIFNNIIIIAFLMGESSLGIFYLAESKVKEELKIFRLPFLLSLISIGYYLISPTKILNSLIFLIIIWFLFSLIFILKNNNKFKALVKQIIKCCRDW